MPYKQDSRQDKNQEPTWYCGRRPKQDDFDDLEPFESEEEEGDDDDANDDENEEVDFDNPNFKKTDFGVLPIDLILADLAPEMRARFQELLP